ncbi:MAG: SDR family oxidoreductase [Planctomycetota bacterium]
MSRQETHTVTGAFGYSGRYIAKRLLEAGHRVNTLTNSMDRKNPFDGTVAAFPYCFDAPDELTRTLQGTTVLYNTYWVRFNHRDFRHDDALQNTLTLFAAAKAAGVQRVVHVSITNPSEDSPLEYFAGKAQLERALRESGLSHAILRPTVLFGKEDILINNIAWALRTYPVFAVFGDGAYRVQPIYVDDLARLAVEQGSSTDNCTIDAIGPETFTYRRLVETIAAVIGVNPRIISTPPFLGYVAGVFMGWRVGDVVITRQEIEGLMAGLLATDSPPTGHTRLTDWAREHKDELGQRYASELARRRNRMEEYQGL